MLRIPLKLVFAGILLLLSTRNGAADSDVEITVRRLPVNPIIALDSSQTLGNKINGPSVIRVPSWVEAPLGKYYLYFAHHKGKFIRLAYADSVAGPWQIYEPGTLQLQQVSEFRNHIASPDVHVDEQDQVIRMYFHGSRWEESQKTSVASSSDGIHFRPSGNLLGNAYFRVFRWRGGYYAIDNHGFLNRSVHPEKDWQSRPQQLIAPITIEDEFGQRSNVRIRHSAVWLQGETLYLFYTRKADAPERILLTRVTLTDDWSNWTAASPTEVLRPQTDYEGIDFPIAPSTKGGAVEVQQLRDPCIFYDDGRVYLFYAVAGEMGIAVAELTIHDSHAQ
ncbi:MAG: hypothetical protein ACR2NM_17880 [Bythopirellula sp.]